MTKQRVNDPSRPGMGVACPLCGAEVGRLCRTRTTGVSASTVHVVRLDAEADAAMDAEEAW